MTRIPIELLNAAAFAPFGDVLEAVGPPSFQINAGMCDRYHDLARLEFVGSGARANISMARSKPCRLPLVLEMVERHPLGSQAFIPLSGRPFLVVVAADVGGVPRAPRAFLTRPGQGVNYHRNTWHGVLAPLGDEAVFAIVDRVGDGDNLEEHTFSTPYIVGPELPAD